MFLHAFVRDFKIFVDNLTYFKLFYVFVLQPWHMVRLNFLLKEANRFQIQNKYHRSNSRMFRHLKKVVQPLHMMNTNCKDNNYQEFASSFR